MHGGISWLVATPLLVVQLVLGAANAYGGWYGGFVTPLGTRLATARRPRRPQLGDRGADGPAHRVDRGDDRRLDGSGEPMTFTHYRKRNDTLLARKGGI